MNDGLARCRQLQEPHEGIAMGKFVDYSALVKKANPKGDAGKQLQQIAQRLDASRKSVRKNPAKNIPAHVKLLTSSQKELSKLKKGKKTDKNELKVLDTVLKQVAASLKMLSGKPKVKVKAK